ncbi:MAG TPA: gephyrin-like molybdotransferase Glp [Gemmatimonas sp.]|uniref:molybdopterin molybdotransferase MoeA n=1 Tax=Gemmatimonas sp. TaxID=1962908 RepID=UPI002EDB92EC
MSNEPTVRRGLSYDDALTSILRATQDRATEVVTLPLTETLGRALAESITSRVSLPPWDNAGMDGYAVRRADVVGASAHEPRALPVVGTSVAGSDPSALPAVTPHTAVRIMTGAPMPPGADAVIRIEDTDDQATRNGDGATVRIVSDRDTQGRGNVRPRGEDVAVGVTLFTPGTSIRAAHLGMLASVGQAVVRVHRAPRVTVLSSGDELVPVEAFDEVLSGRRIVSSSSYALPALLRSAGAHVTMAPLVPDTLQAMTDAMDAALGDGCDLLITTGGVSVGAHDYTRDALMALGGTQQFWRARIRPGGPIGTGMVRDVPWIGLPGNPVSTLVTGMLFAWPLLRQLGGHITTCHVKLPVRMCEHIDTPAALSYFLRARLSVAMDGVLEATIAGPQGSNLQQSMVHADALVLVPEEVSQVQPGMMLSALLLPDAPFLTAA